MLIVVILLRHDCGTLPRAQIVKIGKAAQRSALIAFRFKSQEVSFTELPKALLAERRVVLRCERLWFALTHRASGDVIELATNILETLKIWKI